MIATIVYVNCEHTTCIL